MFGERKTRPEGQAAVEQATLYQDFRVLFAVFFGGFALCIGLVELTQLVLHNVGHSFSVLFWGWLAATSLRIAWSNRAGGRLPARR